MSDLPSLTPKALIRILVNNGFIEDRVKGSHKVFYHQESRKRVVIPCHVRDLPKGTLMAIIKEAGLNKDDLKD